jgi:pyruvate formate lyase activating enzyme
MEKKPLYHFHPGRTIFSIGTRGCNLRCGFCQNWQIAHSDAKTVYYSPRQVVEATLRTRREGSPCAGIAYTYSEPLMWYEFVYDTSRLAREAGLVNVLVTNGYVNEKPLLELLPYVDAMNIDVKAFTDEFYRNTCAGRLDPVLKTVELASARCHVEITTLLVTGLNDSEEEVQKLTDWLAGLDPEIPLHFSRYFPKFQLELPPTPLETLSRAREIARQKLKYVYIGNAPQLDGGATSCPECGEVVIRRPGYRADLKGMVNGRCKNCSHPLRVVGAEHWSER